jgi:glycosyltransferase involved in cell wall biosynthesis
VPYTFFPDEPGGTEIYVAGLIAAMRDHGFDGAVAAPGNYESVYDYQGIAVYRFKGNARPAFEYAYGVPDEVAADSFRAMLQRLQPAIVHIHAHTAAVSERLADAARTAGAKLFFTYHTPGVNCLRGTMMLMGAMPCDGVLDVRRCAICTLQKHGVPAWLGNILNNVPVSVGRAAANSGLSGSAITGLRMSELTTGFHARFHALMEKVDCVVAVCQWAMDALIANGVPQSKLVLCRQGLHAGLPLSCTERASNLQGNGVDPLRLAYFGRLDPAKGLDVVIEAIKRIPDVRLTLDVYGIAQPGSTAYLSRLKSAADRRVRFHESLSPDAVPNAMANVDFVVIPSRWLETGPLVAYEAFAAGTPVLGSRLGGIEELVSDEVDGVLLAMDDPESWAQNISALAQDRTRVIRLRNGVRPPRTMTKVADEMAAHYRRVLTEYA